MSIKEKTNIYKRVLLEKECVLDTIDYDFDIYFVSLSKLTELYEKKIHDNIYIHKINNIINYRVNKIEPYNFNYGFKVHYIIDCYICDINIGDILNAKISKIINTFVKLEYGPIIIFSIINRINKDNFIFTEDYLIYKHNNKKISIGDNVLIKIVSYICKNNKTNIVAIADILDIIK